MSWILDLHRTTPVAHAIGVLALVCLAGMLVGSIKVRGIGLGTAGVLFAGIVAGHFGKPIDHETLELVKELGLVLFVFTIGLQLGPGFFAALRREGLSLNLVALGVVALGSATAVGLGWLLGLDPAAMLGILSGSTTNTPSLGAAQQTIAALPGVGEERVALPALAYAVTYPAAIAGIIGALLILKRVFRIDGAAEAAALAAERRGRSEPLATRSLIVENPNLAGVAIQSIPSRRETGVIISRHRRAGESAVQAARGSALLQLGDALLAIGEPSNLDQLQRVVGRASDEDLRLAPGSLSLRRIVATRRDVLGKSIGELALDMRFDAVVSRVTRADIELTAIPGIILQFGDMLQVVGTTESLEQVEKLLGNAVHELNETHFIPIYFGIALGIALGTLPIAFAGLPQPLRLGLAGGPLLVALLLGRFGRIGRLVCHVPVNANLALRELGIALFFAAVGLAAGPRFFSTVLTPRGLLWLAVGICVTMVPLLAAGIAVRIGLKMNFAVLSGLLAGSVTDPPALAFANSLTRSDLPTVAYATVFPLTTLLRILTAQILALALVG